MKIYALTSTKFAGEVIFEFTGDILSRFDVSGAELSPEQHRVIVQDLPHTLSEVRIYLSRSKTSTLTEIIQNISFEDFWKRYDDRSNSSRKKTEAKWNKMPVSEQIKAYNYIQKYFLNIPSGTRKKYAETYLSAELWNN